MDCKEKKKNQERFYHKILYKTPLWVGLPLRNAPAGGARALLAKVDRRG
jgi:hypothetical protein